MACTWVFFLDDFLTFLPQSLYCWNEPSLCHCWRNCWARSSQGMNALSLTKVVSFKPNNQVIMKNLMPTTYPPHTDYINVIPTTWQPHTHHIPATNCTDNIDVILTTYQQHTRHIPTTYWLHRHHHQPHANYIPTTWTSYQPHTDYIVYLAQSYQHHNDHMPTTQWSYASHINMFTISQQLRPCMSSTIVRQALSMAVCYWTSYKLLTLQAVSGKDAPINNFFFYDGVDGSGVVENFKWAK